MLAAALVIGVLAAVPARAVFPFPGGGDPYDYTRLHIKNGSCAVASGEARPAGSDLPANFDCRGDWKLSDYAMAPGDEDYDPLVALNPQEFNGVKGPGTNRAWEITTGRPDTVIAVTDSGIRWDEKRPNLVNKFFLNRGELPVPGSSRKGGSVRDYDHNRDGVFNVRDYADDARAKDLDGDDNTDLDPGDLIRTFSDSRDDDGNGYVDDISGWDFFENDNNPNDDVDYGHGTGESEDSSGETGIDIDPQCPNCRVMEMRVGDSFVADVNHFAEAAVYATDNGASIIQSALGTLNHTGFAQAAADYAWERGVLFVASAADEAAGHHNFPSALNHTMTVNSITNPVDVAQVPRSYLSFNGCTNFGGYIWTAIPSTSCSSDAVGQSAGMAGLLYSAARNAVDKGVIKADRSGRPLSAPEAKQLFRAAADDIDFSTPKPPFPPNNFATSLPASQRYVTTAGWDQTTGWGRINSNRLVRLVAENRIPPEADLTAPRWWQPLPTTGTVDVVGRVAAPRAASYTYEVQFAPGVQPPRYPLGDTWVTVAKGDGKAPKQGVLARLDMAKVRTAIDAAPAPYTPLDDPTSRSLPEKDAFRVRLVVRDDRPQTPDAVEQREHFSVANQGLMGGFPRFLGADGAHAGAFEDLDGDGRDELVIGDGNGLVHAFRADGTEADGWPTRTPTIALPTGGRNAYGRGEMASEVGAALLLGSPAVADLDGDGRPEVVVADIDGHIDVWDHEGQAVAGFPVTSDPALSHEPGCQLAAASRPGCDDYGPHDARDRINSVDHGFTATPSIGDLDRSAPGLEIVAGGNDGHVYAWHADGSPVPGWPVLLRDPAKVASVDPVSHKVTFKPDAGVKFGRKVIATPTLGDIDGDGRLEVVANVNEEYLEEPNASGIRDVIVPALGAAGLNDVGNTRVYALHGDGTRHQATAAQQATPHPDDQAYVAGWPVPIAYLTLELLPYVGEGSNGAPVLADIDGDGTLEIGTASVAGPPYLLNHDGTGVLGDGPDGHLIALATSLAEFKNPTATDGPSIASLGGGVFGRLAPGSSVSFAMGSTGLRRLLDVVLPEQQLLAEDHVSAWSTVTGSFEPGFPSQMNDLQFFNTPAIVDVDGDGRAEVLEQSAMYDLRAHSIGGSTPSGWPKFTGGWGTTTPAVGDLDGDGRLDVAAPSREGNLFVWRASGPVCGGQEWPKYQHDLHNSGNYGTDGRRPGAVRDLAVEVVAGQVVVSWRATGDDADCGRAHHYDVRVDDTTRTVAATAAPGGRERLVLARPSVSGVTAEVQAVDDAGNRGFPRSYPPD